MLNRRGFFGFLPAAFLPTVAPAVTRDVVIFDKTVGMLAPQRLDSFRELFPGGMAVNAGNVTKLLDSGWGVDTVMEAGIPLTGHFVEKSGQEFWILDGKRHRLDGPAVIHPDGKQQWYRDGERHRLDGPAIIFANGEQQWCQNGKLHRVDGPAITCCSDGTQLWYQNGELHRLDGPAIVREDGTRRWYRNGLRHRLDGPAVIHPNGDQFWYREDVFDH